MPSASRSFFDFAAVPSNPQSLVCQTQTVCLLRRGGWWWDEGEAVSGGSTLLRSSLDQGRRLDMNMGRSSPWTSQPVTLVQNGLTDSALAVSLAALCMYFMAGVERKRVVALFFLFWVWQVKDRLLSVRSFHLSLLFSPVGGFFQQEPRYCRSLFHFRLLSFKELTEAITSLQFPQLCTFLNQSTPCCFLLCY